MRKKSKILRADKHSKPHQEKELKDTNKEFKIIGESTISQPENVEEIKASKWSISDRINFSLALVTFLLFAVAFFSIRYTQGQFQTDNEAFVEVDVNRIDTLIIGNCVSIPFLITNFGKYPVKILDCEIQNSIQSTIPSSALQHLTKPNEEIKNRYLNAGSPIDFRFNSDSLLTKQELDNIKQKNEFVFFWGRIIYLNLVTQKKRNYAFCIKFKDFQGLSYEYSKNVNSSDEFNVESE